MYFILISKTDDENSRMVPIQRSEVLKADDTNTMIVFKMMILDEALAIGSDLVFQLIQYVENGKHQKIVQIKTSGEKMVQSK